MVFIPVLELVFMEQKGYILCRSKKQIESFLLTEASSARLSA